MFERLPTYAFGMEFTHIPEHVRQDLETLDRESAIYTDYWIEEVGDFRHVRIDLTPAERQDFARRCWAYELFLRYDCPEWAADTPGIDEDVAKDVDTYEGPYQCFAAFLGEHLEALVCSRTDREVVIELLGREAALFDVRRAIESLTATIRSFNNREQHLASWQINCEDDVRDLLYVMLRPRVFDIKREEAVPSKLNSYKIVDLCSDALRLLIELKWIDKQTNVKKIIDQISVDIQTYIRHPSCDNIWFVIVDAVRAIQDPRQLESELSQTQTIDGRDVDIRAIVCEP